MEKVLLAINGTKPDHKAFQYAVDLCLRMKADLKILQIITPHDIGGYIEKLKNKAHNAKRFLEGSMVAATFAEAGEHETAEEIMDKAAENIKKLLPESAKLGISCDLVMKTGKTAQTVVNFVHENKDIVIAVYDTAKEENSRSNERQIKNELKSISKGVTIPVVMVQNES